LTKVIAFALAAKCAGSRRPRTQLRATAAAAAGTVMELFSPAKVNLFLRIIRKREDGYHDLASLFHTVSFGDKLTMEVLPETATADELKCNLPHVPVDESNLVIRALNLFRDRSGVKTFFKLDLQKSMPAEAGLGGGSSNGATAFWGANALAGFPATATELLKWADDPVVGSDATFFLSEGTAYCTGRGEIVTPMDPLPVVKGTPLYLVKPNYGCSTGKIFKALDYDGLSKSDPEELLAAFTERGFDHDFWVNDLEPPAMQVVPELGALKEYLASEEFGFQAVMMSGSGSTLICVGAPSCGEAAFKKKVDAKFEIEGVWSTQLMRRAGATTWYQAPP